MNDIRNLLPDPKPTDTSDWVVPSSRDVRVQMLDGNRLHLTNNADNADSYVYTQVSLPAGQYRFGVEVSAPQGAAPTKLLRVVVPPRTELTPAIWDGQTGRVVTPPNTLPEDGELEFRVMVGPTTGCAIWVRRLFVMTDDDWQRMLDAGIAWFDGDSRANSSGRCNTIESRRLQRWHTSSRACSTGSFETCRRPGAPGMCSCLRKD